MKAGEFEEWMANLATVSGVPREMLDRTPARVLFALSTAIEERDRRHEGWRALTEEGNQFLRDLRVACYGPLANEIECHATESPAALLRQVAMYRTLLDTPSYEPKDPIEEGIRRSQRGKE